MQAEAKTLEKQKSPIDNQIEALLDQIIESGSTSVIKAYESKIAKLERNKGLIDEQMQKTTCPPYTL